MKKILTLLCLLMAGATFAQDSDEAPQAKGKGKEGVCSRDLVESERNARLYSDQGNSSKYPGTTIFEKCGELSRGNIRKIYSKNGGRSDFDWKNYITYACNKKGLCPASDTQNKETKYADCINTETKLAISCESVLHAMSFYDRDWNDTDQIMPAGIARTQTAPAQQQPGQNGAAGMAAATSQIKCQSMGMETVDYIPCRKFQVQLELIEGVQGVAYGAQELVYREKISDAQTKHATDENAATGALKGTRDSLKMQQDMYQQRTAIDATKLAYLVSIYNEMPTSSEVTAKCDRLAGKPIEGLSAPIEKEACVSAVRAGTGGFAVTMNGPQMDAMKAKLVSIAAQAGSSLLLANLMGKRAKDIDNAIAKIDDFKPLDPYVATEEDAATTFCKQNPGLPQCLTGGLERTFDQVSDNIITFSDSGPATNYAGNNPGIEGSGTGEGIGQTDNTPTNAIGSIVPAAIHDNSIEASKAAKVTSTGAKSSGGGGGGGSAGGGGGSGGLPQSPAQGGVTAAVQGKTPTYTGGSGSISMMGGFGINKPKGEGKGEENPFGKLFGKEKGSGVVNFRDIASKVGGKDDNLFEMITNRYKSVSADKRLIEYELTK